MKLDELKWNISSDMDVYLNLTSIVSLTLDNKVSWKVSFPMTLFDVRNDSYDIVHERKKPDMR